ncbi:hypothetical protein ACWDRB_29415 [Nonomuraea sp. NPDC003707]
MGVGVLRDVGEHVSSGPAGQEGGLGEVGVGQGRGRGQQPAGGRGRLGLQRE